jgi:DNA-binding CsgD family transcriptional regulator
MFARSGPILSVNGHLVAGASGAGDRLRRILAKVARRESDIGVDGVGMAFTTPDHGVATAHVLPLTNGDVRTRLAPRAVAAIFISSKTSRSAVALEGVAETFSLTPAETRLLGRLAMGDSIDAAASALGVTRPTVKTHLARILSKTGSRRQADLVALVHRLVPPTAAGGDEARI